MEEPGESLAHVVRLDEVAMRYRVSCEICGSQVALNLGGLEVRILEEGGVYVALVQLPLPGDYMDEYLLREYLRRYCLFLGLAASGALLGARYELRPEIPSLVARVELGSLGRAVRFVEEVARAYESLDGRCRA